MKLTRAWLILTLVCLKALQLTPRPQLMLREDYKRREGLTKRTQEFNQRMRVLALKMSNFKRK